jgi:pyruvate dehydrogenase E2 component (dihydrolipoamide acetyltransferase)
MIEFRMPSLGADMDEAMLVTWLVAPGDTVHRGQVIAEVETDKGIIEVECWDEGTVVEFLVQPGPEMLTVGTPLAVLEPLTAASEAARHEAPGDATTPSEPAHVAAPGMLRSARSPGRQVPPPIRHLAHELGVDLTDVAPSGGDGRVTRDDVRRAAAPAAEGRVRATPMARRLAEERGVALESVSPTRTDGLIVSADLVPDLGTPTVTAPPADQVEASLAPESGAEDKGAAMRRAIARSMTRSKREIPHYYLATHIDLDRAMRWLDSENEQRPITRRLIPALLLVKATALALREYPDLNGHFVDDDYRGSADIHVGIAVSLRGGGLVAPAIHNTDRLDLDELMTRFVDLVARARSWRLRSSEMSDATITVTNLGDRGAEAAFPVIIPPQVAIVGFGKVTDEPVVVDGAVGVHPRVYATLAGDHRVTDGHTGGLLLATIDRLLQEPEQL